MTKQPTDKNVTLK
uniref:BLTX214 n=1 Tax=Nephila pilipes TaxID=299642 RepID=A0A076L201_NEPPI|nr:BLTX214 [Nephila pilipes]